VAIQIALSVAQLAVVPTFAIHWGARVYGVWLMLFTIPSYLAMADLGLASAAANDMTAQVARGDRQSAIAVYQAVRLVTIGICAIVIGITTLILFVLAPHMLDGAQEATGGHASAIMFALMLYGVMALQNNLSSAGMRATGGYALSGYLGAGILLAEAFGALILVITGHDILVVSLYYLTIRGVSVVVFTMALARRAPWLVTLRWQSSMGVLRKLLRPALAVMILPAAQAASIQGTVLMIGFAMGSAAVPAFTAVRTLSRVAIQAILIVNHAVMPSMTAAVAVADKVRVARYATISYATSLAMAIPGSLMLLLGGQLIVRLWTHGVLHPGEGLLAVMAASMLLNALWQPASNLILAINQHERFTWFYLATAVCALGLCFPFTKWLGASGAALSVLLIDVLMLWRIAGLSRQLGLLDISAIVPQLAGILHERIPLFTARGIKR
jgi:O-antigen/teichoic acid export membrane protein